MSDEDSDSSIISAHSIPRQENEDFKDAWDERKGLKFNGFSYGNDFTIRHGEESTSQRPGESGFGATRSTFHGDDVNREEVPAISRPYSSNVIVQSSNPLYGSDDEERAHKDDADEQFEQWHSPVSNETHDSGEENRACTDVEREENEKDLHQTSDAGGNRTYTEEEGVTKWPMGIRFDTGHFNSSGKYAEQSGSIRSSSEVTASMSDTLFDPHSERDVRKGDDREKNTQEGSLVANETTREQGLVEKHLQGSSSQDAIIEDFENYFSSQLESFSRLFEERNVNYIPSRELLSSLTSLFSLRIDQTERKRLIEHALYLVKHLKFAIVMIFLDERQSYVDTADEQPSEENDCSHTRGLLDRLKSMSNSRKRQREFSEVAHEPSDKKTKINNYENYSTFSGLVSNCVTLLRQLRDRDDKFHRYFSLTRDIMQQSEKLSNENLQSYDPVLDFEPSFQSALISETQEDRKRVKAVQKSGQLEDSILFCRKMSYLVTEYKRLVGVEKYHRVFSSSERYLIVDGELEDIPSDNLLRKLKGDLKAAPDVAAGAAKSVILESPG